MLAVVALYSLLFMRIGDAPIVTQNLDMSADKSDIRTYHKFIVADDWRLRELLLNIASNCAEYDKPCVVMNSYNFVKNDIILNSHSSTLSPTQTAKTRVGSANDKAILFASLLKNANFDIKLTYQDEMLYPILCDVSDKDIFNAISKWQANHPIIEKQVTINKGKTYAVWLDNEDVIDAKAVAINYTATYPIDLIQFNDDNELNHYIKDKTGIYFKDCTIFNNQLGEIKCYTPKKSLLAFLSQYDNNKVDINVRLAGVDISDIRSVTVNGKACIPIDFTTTNAISYPGILNFNPERLIAIGR